MSPDIIKVPHHIQTALKVFHIKGGIPLSFSKLSTVIRISLQTIFATLFTAIVHVKLMMVSCNCRIVAFTGSLHKNGNRNEKSLKFRTFLRFCAFPNQSISTATQQPILISFFPIFCRKSVCRYGFGNLFTLFHVSRCSPLPAPYCSEKIK
jgi:hypothetical protein